jgi:hypothetical protein
MKSSPVLLGRAALGLAVCSLLLVPGAWAVDRYLTPTGAGLQDGTSWANAYAASSLGTVVNSTMAAGDTLYLEGNHYGSAILNITASGTSTARKRIIGVDRGVSGYPKPVFEGTSKAENQGGCIRLQSGASYWELQNLEGRRRGWALYTYGANAGLVINNVGCYNTVHGIAFNDADDLQIVNAKVANYTKYGIHLIQGCDDATITNCHADGSGTGDAGGGSSSLAGFMLHTDTAATPMNTNVALTDCSSRNHVSSGQGDGYLVEYNNTGVTFLRCVSFDNGQAGFDAKGLQQEFTDCVAVRVGNGFKIWKNATMYNCIAAETTGNVLFLPQIYSGNEYVLDAYNCTFQVSNTNSAGACVYVEHGPSGNKRATLYNCLLTRVNASSSYSKNIIAGGFSGLSGTIDTRAGTADETKQHNSVSNLANAPRYTAMTQPWKPWDSNLHLTADTAYDSITYGNTKGYHSTLITPDAFDIEAEADCFVYNFNPNTNYNTTDLYVKDAPSGDQQDRISYLRFPLSALTGPAGTATLKLVVTSVESGVNNPTVQIRQVTGDSWTETGTTYNNRPAETGTLVASFNATTSPAVYEIDVTAYVNQEQASDGKVTFCLVQPSNLKKGVHIGSRESGGNKPLLSIE